MRRIARLAPLSNRSASIKRVGLKLALSVKDGGIVRACRFEVRRELERRGVAGSPPEAYRPSRPATSASMRMAAISVGWSWRQVLAKQTFGDGEARRVARARARPRTSERIVSGASPIESVDRRCEAMTCILAQLRWGALRVLSRRARAALEFANLRECRKADVMGLDSSRRKVQLCTRLRDCECSVV